MSSPIHHLQALHNNPFIFASAFVTFFDALDEKEGALLLGYLVLPITLHLPSRDFLQKESWNSSLRSMLKDRTRIHGLDERLARHREMTNTTVQYLLGAGALAVHGQLAVSVTNQRAIDGPSPEGVVKAARQLGKFFHPYDVPMIFRKLGVMSL